MVWDDHVIYFDPACQGFLRVTEDTPLEENYVVVAGACGFLNDSLTTLSRLEVSKHYLQNNCEKMTLELIKTRRFVSSQINGRNSISSPFFSLAELFHLENAKVYKERPDLCLRRGK